jgi:hypothetical protein
MVIRVASGLLGLAWGYPSYHDTLSVKISLRHGGRPMMMFWVRLVAGYPTG